MAKRTIRMTFPEQLVKEPVTFRMAVQFDLLPNIRRARVTETAGELVLELEGSPENLERGLRYLEELGVQVTPVEGDLLE